MSICRQEKLCQKAPHHRTHNTQRKQIPIRKLFFLFSQCNWRWKYYQSKKHCTYVAFLPALWRKSMFSRQYNCGTLQHHQSALKSCVVHVNAMLRDKEALNFTPRTPYHYIFIAMQQISYMTVVAAFRSSTATHFPIRGNMLIM